MKQLINTVRNQGLQWGCPNIKGELEKLIFLYFRCVLPEACLWILLPFQLKDESGDFAKVQRYYLTKIFLDYCYLWRGPSGQIMAMKQFKSGSQATPRECAALKKNKSQNTICNTCAGPSVAESHKKLSNKGKGGGIPLKHLTSIGVHSFRLTPSCFIKFSYSSHQNTSFI